MIEPWKFKALCFELISKNEIEPDAFITDDESRDAELSAICAQCPVRRECLESAISDETSQGFLGGYRFDRGKVPRDDVREIFKEQSLVARGRNVYKNVETDDV